MLEKELLWNSAEYGFFTSAYGWFNVFLLMLILGGIILDKMGVRFTGIMATSIMVIGTAIKYWAISTHSLDGQTILGMKAQVVIAGLGFATFGVGVEIAGITVSKIIVKWFKGKEMALAMGLEMATARIGTTHGNGNISSDCKGTSWGFETNTCMPYNAVYRYDIFHRIYFYG